jgi:transglutaminase-like putative cysteine protease
VPAFIVGVNWIRLEEPRTPGAAWLTVVALAVVPALAGRLWLRAVLLLVAVTLAARSAFGVSLLDARPWDDERDFLGPVADRFGDGFLAFYDVSLPFGGTAHPQMHGVVLAAIFGFCLLIALAIASRRPLVAALALVVGAGWPATLLPGGNELGRGAFILLGALILLAGLSFEEGGVLARAAAAAGVVVLAALAASTSPAVAKDEFLNWQSWDFYTKPDDPVGVRYVWDSSYAGIDFPEKQTTVLEVKAPPRQLYWRATTLDVFDGFGWREDVDQLVADAPRSIDRLLPPQAQNRRRWIEQEVRIAALRDTHLVAASAPVDWEWEEDALGPIVFGEGGVAIAPEGVSRDQSYRVWSYAPQPSPRQLARVQPDYPPELEVGGFLNVLPGAAAPFFGAPDREARMAGLFEDYARFSDSLEDYRPLYEVARNVVGRPTTPYAAAIALEAYLRRGGGFVYDERPPQPQGDPPLVAFVTDTKSGYCQHYAGAMALMLRFLGIPARVAAGFTSGRYSDGVWTVTDHEAHTWVEVWFDGYGWLPFDPTPARGRLSASYTTASQTFGTGLGAGIFGSLGELGRNAIEESRTAGASERPGLQGTGADRGGGALGGAAGELVTKERGASLLRFLVLVALALGTAIALAKLVLRRARFLTRDPRRLAGACRRELVDFLLDQGIRLAPSATLAELGALLAEELDVDARPFVTAATAARYGPLRDASAAAARARDELRALERVIRRRLSASERARGLLSLRSLGFAS